MLKVLAYLVIIEKSILAHIHYIYITDNPNNFEMNHFDVREFYYNHRS